MSDKLRKVILIAGFILLAFGGVLWWRATHPPLTDEQQVLANLDAVRHAVEARRPRDIAYYLAKGFTLNGQPRSDVVNMMKGALLQAHEVQLNVSNVQVKVRGDTATSFGRYRLTANSRGDPTARTRMGEFTLNWRKTDGVWKIAKAEGTGDFD
ncbi:MAG: nuclear transport factor 2 family protein [Armatimonadota bacterium]|nr:nuclear transport factor 2 family protein [Armatimonadota bacterium]